MSNYYQCQKCEEVFPAAEVDHIKQSDTTEFWGRKATTVSRIKCCPSCGCTSLDDFYYCIECEQNEATEDDLCAQCAAIEADGMADYVLETVVDPHKPSEYFSFAADLVRLQRMVG